MNTINLQASANNLPQMDRHQTDAHRTPVSDQVQNAAIADAEHARRLQQAVQPDQTDGKNVDPKAKRREDQKSKKRKPRSPDVPKRDPPSKTGYFVDLNA